MDVAEAIDAEAILVQRSAVADAGGSYDADGRWQDATAPSSDIYAAVQPATGRNLIDAPEGVRSEARFAIWSRAAIKENDRVTVSGETYRVIWTAPRPMDGFTKGALGLMS